VDLIETLRDDIRDLADNVVGRADNLYQIERGCWGDMVAKLGKARGELHDLSVALNTARDNLLKITNAITDVNVEQLSPHEREVFDGIVLDMSRMRAERGPLD
jgi:hypothetical protein